MNPLDSAFQDHFKDQKVAEQDLAVGAGRSVLLVDDDPHVARVVCRILSLRFERVELATSGEEALDRINAGENFAVVLSDQNMQGMDGTSFLGLVRELAPLTTRMMYTGLHDLEVTKRALAEGQIFRILTKPCPTEEVTRSIEDAILKHRRKATDCMTKERLRFAHESIQGFNDLLEKRLERAQYSVVLALAKLAEERDNCTGKHLDRVSAFCRELAMGLSKEGAYADPIDNQFIRDIELCAPLHDIGKVGIPDSVLLKPGKLDTQDWELMRTHPTIGAKTLEAIILANPGTTFLTMGYDVALCHHEFWNGNGYPQGLVGDATPLSARILKVADCYDALTTERPYKHAWTHEESMAHLVEHAGTEFDPVVVDCLQAIEAHIRQLRIALSDDDIELAA